MPSGLMLYYKGLVLSLLRPLFLIRGYLPVLQTTLWIELAMFQSDPLALLTVTGHIRQRLLRMSKIVPEQARLLGDPWKFTLYNHWKQVMTGFL
jgi:hypothetical protein